MNNNRSIAGLSMVALAAFLLLIAILACGPGQDGTPGSDPPEPSGDDAVDPSGDDPPPPTATATATATPTTSIPAAPSPTPTQEEPGPDGVFERAFFDPAADMGPPDEYDAFDGNDPLFFERWNDHSAAWYGTDQRYHIIYSFEDKWVWYWTDVYGYDFYADVVIINSDSCVEGDSAGLIFRGHLGSDAGYMFGVTCEGSYFTGATVIPGSGGAICWVGNGYDDDCSPGAAAASVVPSEFINAGPGAANRLGVMAEGLTFTYYINGQKLVSYTRPGSSLIEGYFTLYLGTAQEYNAEAIFDDFSVWHLP
jgi:hypothetical protein